MLGGDVAHEVSKLEQTLDGEIVVHGSAQLAQALIEHDLVDELRLMASRWLLGSGKRLFGAGGAKKPLRLAKPESRRRRHRRVDLQAGRRAGRQGAGSRSRDAARRPASRRARGALARAACECARLSREEISTSVSSAPTSAKPEPTRNARSKPFVSAIGDVVWPARIKSCVRLLAIVARIASPSAPPTCCAVLTRPDASPASCGRVR